jgi:glycosyltransferase involved in cell wall biosynthesis
MRFSVIIPTVNKGKQIVKNVKTLEGMKENLQIIVSVGGSTDQTLTEARRTGAIVVRSKRGRGSQCNRGAIKASGDLLIFLHADTLLPENAFTLIEQNFNNLKTKIAKFKVRFVPPQIITGFFMGINTN